MLDKLNALSDDALLALRDHVDEAYRKRMYRLLSPGREATFNSNKRGGTVIRIMITGRGPKNITGYEIDANGFHLHNSKWRVGPELLTPVLAKPKAASQPLRTGKDLPATAGAAMF